MIVPEKKERLSNVIKWEVKVIKYSDDITGNSNFGSLN